MGRRGRGEVECYEGRSEFESEENPASLEEAIDEALAAARDGGAAPGTVFDVMFTVELREENQNVRVYSAVATSRPGGGS